MSKERNYKFETLQLHVGQEQPTVLARVNGEYRIIDGHRRNAANI